jgi:hypothetical protein
LAGPTGNPGVLLGTRRWRGVAFSEERGDPLRLRRDVARGALRGDDHDGWLNAALYSSSDAMAIDHHCSRSRCCRTLMGG